MRRFLVTLLISLLIIPFLWSPVHAVTSLWNQVDETITVFLRLTEGGTSKNLGINTTNFGNTVAGVGGIGILDATTNPTGTVTGGGVLYSDSGALSWLDTAGSVTDLTTGGGGGGANTALSNLAAVAVNTDIISDTDSTDSLGSAAISWLNIFVDNIGATGTRVVKGWFTDLEVTNAIAGSITGNAATVTNATLTTALTIDTGTVGITGNVANTSVLTLGAGASSVSGANTGDQTSIVGISGTTAQFNTALSDGSFATGGGTATGTNTGDQTTVSGNAGTATALETARNIGGVSFDGTAAITPTTIAVTDTVDTTSFVGLWESATGNLLPQTDLGITYNAGTAALSATTFIGALTGNADTVTTNANLTGHITSTGNAAILGAFTTAQLSTALSDGTVATSNSTNTFTNKTFDANGTGNSLSNVDIEDLSNGTDGELITWDAAGAPAAVAVGTATHVLTSNGVGVAPTFQAATGGASYGDAITGTSGNGFSINNTGSGQATATAVSLAVGDTFNANSTFSNTGAFISNEKNVVTGRNTGIKIQNASTDFYIGQGAGLWIASSATNGTSLALTTKNNQNSSTNGLVWMNLTGTQSGATTMNKIDVGVSAQDHLWLDLVGSQGAIQIAQTTAHSVTTDKLYNVSGNLTWNGSILATGVSVSSFDATVADSGADFTSIETAYNASNFNLLISGALTQSEDVNLDGSDLYMYIPKGVTLTMAANQFVYSAATNVTIRGEGSGVSEIDYTQTAGGESLFSMSSHPTSVIDVADILLDNNSSAGTTRMIQRGVIHVRNVRLEIPNNSNIGIDFTSGTLTDVEIVGGGSSSHSVITGLDYMINNLKLTGTFSSSAANPILTSNGGTGVFIMNNIDAKGVVGNGFINLRGNSSITNLSGDIQLRSETESTGDFMVSNVNLESGSIDFSGTDDVIINNVLTTGTIDMSDSAAQRWKVTNSSFGSTAVVVAGDSHYFSNVRFGGDVTISSGAILNSFTNVDIVGTVSTTGDDTTFTSCKVGADGGGGANTIAIETGANRNIVSLCRTDAVVTDAGTSSVVANNTIY